MFNLLQDDCSQGADPGRPLQATLPIHRSRDNLGGEVPDGQQGIGWCEGGAQSDLVSDELEGAAGIRTASDPLRRTHRS